MIDLTHTRPLTEKEEEAVRVFLERCEWDGKNWINKFDYHKDRKKGDLAASVSYNDYRTICVNGLNRTLHVHVFAATHRCLPVKGYEVDHIDDNEGNNDPSNLQVLSISEGRKKRRPFKCLPLTSEQGEFILKSDTPGTVLAKYATCCLGTITGRRRKAGQKRGTRRKKDFDEAKLIEELKAIGFYNGYKEAKDV